MALKPTFANVAENQYDRNFGGTKIGLADPYISGYHFISITLPNKLADVLGDVRDIGLTVGDAQNVLNGACLAVTTPGGTLNKTDMNGLGGTKWSVPTSLDYTNTVSMRFVEFSYLPIHTIIHAWFRLIRDYRTGTAHSTLEADEYSKENYAGTMFYWTTRPDGISVEYAAFYTGLFPTKDPQDLFAGDVNTVDKVEIDIEFSVDWVWHEPFVYTKCEQLAKERKGMEPHLPGGNHYGENESNV